MQTEREFYAMKDLAQKDKDLMASMNTYQMDMTLQKYSVYLHHDDLVTCSKNKYVVSLRFE